VDRPYHPVVRSRSSADPPPGEVVFGLAPWARRRLRLVQATLTGGAVALSLAFVALFRGAETEAIGYGLAVFFTAVGLGVSIVLDVLAGRVHLVLGPDGVRYDAGTHRLEAAWSDVVAIDLVLRGADTGPALVLQEDRAVRGRGMLRFADLGNAVQGVGLAAPSLGSTIPLGAFVQGDLAGSPLGEGLRRHVPDLLAAWRERHGGA
jgi:hypothetical protein